MNSQSRLTAALCSAFLLLAIEVSALAAPQPNDAPRQLENFGATQEGPGAVKPILWLDEASRSRVSAASSASAEAPIFLQTNDSGFGYFLKSDDTFGLGTWGTYMSFGNGFRPGDAISSYEARIFHSSLDDPSLDGADFMLELWDGDPAGIMETVCSLAGIPAPIPGTQGIIADVPNGALIQARVELAQKVTYDCDRAWMIMTILSGCRATWRLSGLPGGLGDAPPDLGQSDALWMQWPCEAFGTCGIWEFTHCCDNGLPCDQHALPGESTCGGDSNWNVGNTFCGTGSVYYHTANFKLDDGHEDGFVASLFAPTETTMSIVPVSVDELPPSTGNGTDVISLSGDEVILREGGHNVWLEIMIGDWDPHDLPDNDQAGTLAGYQPHINASGGFVSGSQGELDIYVGSGPCGVCSDNAAACYNDQECTAGTCSNDPQLPCHAYSVRIDCGDNIATCDGSPASCQPFEGADDFCAAELGPNARCGPPGYFRGSGTCAWTFTDNARPDWVMAEALATLEALEISTIDSRPSYAVVVGAPHDPVPFPEGGMYAATLVVHVPEDARGTFTIGLKPFPFSVMDTGAGPPVPLQATVPAFITVQTGSCCFNLEDLATGGAGCTEGTETVGSCAQLPGITEFTANASCVDNGEPPCRCDSNEPATFDDNDPCTDDACINGVPNSTSTVCDDGLICTVDHCDFDETNGVTCSTTAVNVNDGLACTNDNCTQLTGITHVPVDTSDGDACTFDSCEEPTGDIFHLDLSSVPNAYLCPTGDPVADGCPGATGIAPVSTTCTDGYCHWIQCFTGVTCSTPVCETPDAPVHDLVPGPSGGLVVSAKNRFLSFRAPQGVCEPRMAARVTFVSAPRPFDLWDGQQLWVTDPVEVNETGGSIPPAEGVPSFFAATLACGEPVFASYGCMDTVHVFHEGIVPNATYRIELLSEFCSPDAPGDFSAPLEITNSIWGDVLEDPNVVPPSAPEGLISIRDLFGIIGRFLSAPNAIIKARADLEPGCIDLTVNISDVLAGLTGFQGLPYPFFATAGDACASTCANPLP